MVIIDIESLFFSVCHYYAKEERETDNFSLYKETLDKWLESILEECNVTEYLAFCDDRPNFRQLLFPEFKADRGSKHFKFMADLKRYGKDKWEIKGWKGLEADDLLAIASKMYPKATLAHIDSDSNQLTGKHYNYQYRKLNWSDGFYNITEEDAKRNLNKVILAGSHNNNKGLVGCGEKCAEGYLDGPNDGIIAAYINGISKAKYDVWRNVQGNGFQKGLEDFYKNTIMTKLLTTMSDANYRLEQFNLTNIEPDFFKPIKYEKPTW